MTPVSLPLSFALHHRSHYVGQAGLPLGIAVLAVLDHLPVPHVPQHFQQGVWNFFATILWGRGEWRKKNQLSQHCIIYFSYKALCSQVSILTSEMDSTDIFVSGTLLWAATVPPKPLIQLPRWLSCPVNEKSKIFLYPTKALQSCSGKFEMEEAAAVSC